MTDDKKPLIMIVEDEIMLLNAICIKLNKRGYDTVSCTSGRQALDYLKSLPKLPNGIWLDYQLRDLNGLEVMAAIKESEYWNSVPVFVVSNSASQEKMLNMLALGAKKYFLKAEHKLDEIIDGISTYLNNGI
ncbi:response regulator transcription factor [candidate division WWE3 bacterium]|uniref:Response regulator transcription factor n=1 Tax=candidate division WWE3 bacterium TaxID=2053526 RepID=A0A7X9HHC1_UNCKA|nr:response regulator transcription factor [candidate division WWE3 bacterium]